MTVYSKLGGTQTITTDGALTLNAASVTTSISGANTIVFIKVTNPSASVAVNLSYSTTTPLITDLNPLIIAPGVTEFIQVAALRNTGPVYFYASALSSVDLYVTPVTIVGV
jgi:hypothetical protein